MPGRAVRYGVLLTIDPASPKPGLHGPIKMIKTESHLLANFRELVTRKFASSSLLVGLCGIVLYQSRQDTLDHTRDTLRDIALIAERDIERNFELYDLSLQAVVDNVKDPEVMALSPRMRREVLFDRAASAKYLGSILVLDARGNIVIDSGSDVPRQGNFADRKYFTVHRDNPNAGTYVSDPYESRLRGGSPSIALTRRISNPDGSFGGIVLLAVNLEYFHALFAGLSLGPHGSLSLIGKNGVMVMRQP